MRIRTLSLIGGVLIGLAALPATQGLLAAQESTPTADEAGMMETATDGETAAKMGQMMDQCLAMMKMMSMMGGDTSGMMGGEGMQGMEDMPQAAATPGA